MDFVVVDIGTGVTKAGINGNDLPSHVFPTMINGTNIGKEAVKKGGICRSLLERGRWPSQENMQKMMQHLYRLETQINPRDYGVLLADVPNTSKSDREKMARLLFETYDVPAIYFGRTDVLSVVSAGKITGAVIESGYGITHTSVIYEGFAMSHLTHELAIGGQDVNDILLKVLTEEKGVVFANEKEKNIVSLIKEKHCRVAASLDASGTDEEDQKIENYELPDGNIIKIGDVERMRPPEVLFNPGVFHLPGDGIIDMITQSINRADEELRNFLWNNVVLSGGNTAFNGMGDRVKNELETVAPATSRLMVEAGVNRKYGAWMGGSMLASLSTFDFMNIKRKNFDEVGESIIHRMCF